MTSPRINVGILGLGRAGWDIHVRQLRTHPSFHIAAVADPDPVRQAEAATELGCNGFRNLEEMIDSGLPQIIVVATPNTLHESDALAVLDAGLHCVIEKPVALSYQGAQKVADKARETGLELFSHHQLLFSPEFCFLRELIDSNLLGEIFEIRFSWSSYARRNDWQTLQANGGGLLNNHGPHALSSMLNLLDARVEELSGGHSHIKDAGDADDHVHFLLRAANGRVGDVFLSTSCAVPQPRFTILGRSGAAVALEAGKAQLRYYDASTVEALPVIDGAAAGRSYKNNDVLPWQEETRDYASVPQKSTFYDNVADVLLQQAPMVVTPESAAEVTRVLDWARFGFDPAAIESDSPVLA